MFKEMEMDEVVFQLMAEATQTKLGYFRTHKKYNWYNESEKIISLFVKEKNEGLSSYCIAYDSRFLEKNGLKLD
jgi:hypothetical protein